MTPYEIDVLLHYHCRAIDHDDIHRNPPVWRPTITWMVKAGLLREMCQPASSTYAITEKGRFYVEEGLCKVPLPVQELRIPERADV